jgi:hypothetical protein
VRKSDLSDYSGELLASTTLRLTDKLIGSAPVDAGTTQDVPFSFPFPVHNLRQRHRFDLRDQHVGGRDPSGHGRRGCALELRT